MNSSFSLRASTAGFSLVEIMVALVIGLLATLVVAQVYSVSEGYKRTTTGGADAQTNSAVALYMIEREIRQAGYGLAPNLEDFGDPPMTPPSSGGSYKYGILALCNKVRTYNSGRTPVDYVYDNSTFAPVVINPSGIPAGDNNSDVVMLTYGGAAGMVGNSVPFAQGGGTVQTGGDSADYIVTSSRAGFNQGDLILAVPPYGSNLDCSIGQITGLPVTAPPVGSQCTPGITGQPNLINHNSLQYLSYYKISVAGVNCQQETATRNKPNGPGVVYNSGSKLYNLGPVATFVSRVYAVRGCATTGCVLTECNILAADCTDVTKVTDPTVWMPVAAGVIGLLAQYGKDTDLDGVVDTWNSTKPAGADWTQVLAFRMAIVARSTQYEKTEVTTSSPVWRQDSTGTADVSYDISGLGDDWKHYRYKLSQSVVPLRNMVWGQQ